jgi:glycosyltransferase involved in cell wall biosynthesis
MYDQGKVDCVILPSIVTLTEKEGIPVSLMEAMAYKIPVIATRTGGIPELLDNGAGILVNEKDHVEMANSIIKLMEDRDYYEELAEEGYNKVYQEFYLPNIVERLIELMK